MVGTSILAPRAASATVTGTVTVISSRFAVKNRMVAGVYHNVKIARRAAELPGIALAGKAGPAGHRVCRS